MAKTRLIQIEEFGARLDFWVESCWNDLTRSRLLGLCRILMRPAQIDARLPAAAFLLGLKTGRWRWKADKRTEYVLNLPEEELYTLIADKKCLGWIHDKANLTAYTLKGFWHRGVYYSGPPTRMLRIPVVEYAFARIAMTEYHSTHKQEHLDKLVGILYRPINPFFWLKTWTRGFNGDRRMPLNQYTLNGRVKRFEKLDPAVKMAAFLQFASGNELLEKRHPLLFRRVDEEEQSTEPQKKADPAAWLKLLFEISGGIFGNLRQTEQTDTAEVFMKMEHDLRKNLDMKDRMNKK